MSTSPMTNCHTQLFDTEGRTTADCFPPCRPAHTHAQWCNSTSDPLPASLPPSWLKFVVLVLNWLLSEALPCVIELAHLTASCRKSNCTSVDLFHDPLAPKTYLIHIFEPHKHIGVDKFSFFYVLFFRCSPRKNGAAVVCGFLRRANISSIPVYERFMNLRMKLLLLCDPPRRISTSGMKHCSMTNTPHLPCAQCRWRIDLATSSLQLCYCLSCLPLLLLFSSSFFWGSFHVISLNLASLLLWFFNGHAVKSDKEQGGGAYDKGS